MFSLELDLSSRSCLWNSRRLSQLSFRPSTESELRLHSDQTLSVFLFASKHRPPLAPPLFTYTVIRTVESVEHVELDSTLPDMFTHLLTVQL